MGSGRAPAQVRHELHHFLLIRIDVGLRGHALHYERAGDHDDRQNLDGGGFCLRQIVDPEPVGAAHFHRNPQHRVKREEERYLQQHRHAPAHGIHAVLLVQVHHFLVLVRLARIGHLDVFVLGINGVDLRLQS